MFSGSLDMLKIQFDRGTSGKCNICLKTRPLSWDHVPPKGSALLSAMQVELLFSNLVGQQGIYKISQNGVKFRTVCRCCNSLLGRQYDPVLHRFTGDVLRFVQTPLSIPPKVTITTRPTALARAVIGHILSGKVTLDDAIFDRKLRECIAQPDKPIHSGIHVFYWVYPFPETIVLRDIGMPSVRGRLSSQFSIFNLLKYAPWLLWLLMLMYIKVSNV